MPFTFSHPAIVISLSKTRFRLSLTGLVAGSIVPDFEYYLQMKLDENTGHHWRGFFLFDFPVAIILCFIFHYFIRDIFIHFLPKWYRLRFQHALHFNWYDHIKTHTVNVAIAISIGICSHLLWDGFTHHDGFFVEQIPFLASRLTLFNKGIYVYALAQFLSSVWGLWIVQRFIAAMPPAPEDVVEPVKNNIIYWAWMAVLGTAIMVVRYFAMPSYSTFWDLFFAAIGSMLYAWLFISMLFKKLVKIPASNS